MRKNKNSDKKNDQVDFRVLHNFIDDLQLNFNNTTRENWNENVERENHRYLVNEDRDKVEEIPKIHQKHIDNLMSNSLFPESLSRSFELELFKKYLGKVKQEKFKENIRNSKQINNYEEKKLALKDNSPQKLNLFMKRKKDSVVNLASKISSFEKTLNKELGRFSLYYGKEQSLERFLIKKNLYDLFDDQENIFAYRSKKININNEVKQDKRLKLKPLIVKNASSVEKLASTMFSYSKRLILKTKLEQKYKDKV